MSLPLFPPVLRLYEVANGCERVEASWVSFLQERTLMFFFRGGILILRIESSIKRMYIEIFPIFYICNVIFSFIVHIIALYSFINLNRL